LKVIVLGSGKIGSVIARDFSKTGAKITLSDVDINRARKAAEKIGADSTIFDTSDYDSMVKTISDFDLVLGALPGDYGFKALEACVEARKSAVDVSFTPEDPSVLSKKAMNAGITIIPDCGVAPGLSNLLVGYGASKLDKVEEAKIMVGGIPESPVPPLGYTVTWSADGLIDEYVREVSIVKDGRLVQTPALSGLENIQFPEVGTLEAFYTDGLRTLVKSFPGVENLYEKTLRYPGHVEKVKLLRELGFFSEEPVMVQGMEVNPKLVSARIFERSLTKPEIGDLLAMMIEVSGEKDGEKKGYRYTVLEYPDRETGVSAMARTTAYTASIVAGVLVDGGVKKKGVVPMEKLGSDHEFVGKVFDELGKRDIEIKETDIG
jgi:lysine 6-dehydrogenase